MCMCMCFGASAFVVKTCCDRLKERRTSSTTTTTVRAGRSFTIVVTIDCLTAPTYTHTQSGCACKAEERVPREKGCRTLTAVPVPVQQLQRHKRVKARIVADKQEQRTEIDPMWHRCRNC